MKKKLIAAGAASLAVAAMPVVGVFAAGPQDSAVLSHTDTINLSIQPVCTLGTVSAGQPGANDATTHTNGTGGTWATYDVNDTVTPTVGRTDTLNVTMAAGTEQPNIGSTTFTVRCNYDGGYTVKAKSDKTNGDSTTPVAILQKGNSGVVKGTDTIETGTGASFDATSSDSYWNFKIGSLGTNVTIGAGYTVDTAAVIPVATSGSADGSAIINGTNGNINGGQSFTVTYGAGINNTQHSGTYTGSVIYTLIPGASGLSS
jgi:hypothetical protein